MAQSKLLSYSELEGVYKLASIITIILFMYLLTFVYKLESTGCTCALDWRRNYIVFYCFYAIILAVAHFFTHTSILVAFAPVTFALGLLFVVFTLQYVHRLKREKCTCSDQIGRVILYLVAAIDAAVFAIIGLMVVVNASLMVVGTRR